VSTISTHREIESKVRVHALFALPTFPAEFTIEPKPKLALHATYFDTPSLALFRWGITLRRRTGGTDAGWHVKFPVIGTQVRDEVRLPLTEGEYVPATLVDIVSPLLLGQPLEPVVSLSTERTPSVIRAADDTEVELVDDTVSILDNDTVVAVFRELEVEATDDAASIALMDVVVRHLQDAGAIPGKTSKASSALGPKASAPPDVRVGPMPGPDGLAADALRVMLATHVRHLMLADVAVRRQLPDSVHQMRVAARRLRSVLTSFSPLFDTEWAQGLRADLKWLAAELGAIRDAEVLQERLEDHAGRLPTPLDEQASHAVHEALARRHDAATSGALAALRSDRHQFLIEDLVDAANTPRFTDLAYRSCREAFPPAMQKAWNALNRSVRVLQLTTPSATWHAARIKAKRARYTAEALSPIFGKDVQKLSVRLADTTEVLGSHQDAFVAQQLLRDVAPGCDGETAFALGMLFEREVDFEMADRETFLATWSRTKRAAMSCELIN
jgi:CHAD domain-containing protein